MKNKFITISLAVSLCFSSMDTQAEQPQKKNSTAHRIAYFLFHGLCTFGGIVFTIKSAETILLSYKIRKLSKLNPTKLEEIKQDLAAKFSNDHDNAAQIEEVVKEEFEFLNKPVIITFASICALGSMATTVYGLQGLVKDARSVIQN